jgi:hypothetical protein
MEHPFIQDLKSLNEDELIQRISDLRSKLTWCMQSGKGEMARQITMAVESYQQEYNRRLAEKNKATDGFQDKITVK